jgi:hypothetical protein
VGTPGDRSRLQLDWRFSDGQKIHNPAHVEWRKNLTQRQPDRTRVRRSPHEFQEAGQKNLEGAFKEVFGRPPGEAMVAFTTTYHPEAYRDIKWLGKKGVQDRFTIMLKGLQSMVLTSQ